MIERGLQFIVHSSKLLHGKIATNVRVVSARRRWQPWRAAASSSGISDTPECRRDEPGLASAEAAAVAGTADAVQHPVLA